MQWRQPRSQGLSSYHPLEDESPGNEVEAEANNVSRRVAKLGQHNQKIVFRIFNRDRPVIDKNFSEEVVFQSTKISRYRV